MKITISLTNKELDSYINTVKPFALLNDDSEKAAKKFIDSCYEIKSYSSKNDGGTLEYTCDDNGLSAVVDINEMLVIRMLSIVGRYGQQIIACAKGVITTCKVLFSNYISEIEELSNEWFNDKNDKTIINGMESSEYYHAKYASKKDSGKEENNDEE